MCRCLRRHPPGARDVARPCDGRLRADPRAPTTRGGRPVERIERISSVARGLGRHRRRSVFLAPEPAGDTNRAQQWARYERGARARAPQRATRMTRDRRARRPAAIHVPTLVLHRTGDPLITGRAGRYLAEHIPGARLRRARRATTTSSGSATRRAHRRGRGVRHRALATCPTPTACSRRSCSPTSSTRPSAPPQLGDAAWRELLEAIDTRVGASSSASAARGEDDRRRLPRHLRRPGARRALRARSRARSSRPRAAIRAGVHTGESS